MMMMMLMMMTTMTITENDDDDDDNDDDQNDDNDDDDGDNDDDDNDDDDDDDDDNAAADDNEKKGTVCALCWATCAIAKRDTLTQRSPKANQKWTLVCSAHTRRVSSSLTARVNSPMESQLQHTNTQSVEA